MASFLKCGPLSETNCGAVPNAADKFVKALTVVSASAVSHGTSHTYELKSSLIIMTHECPLLLLEM